MRGAAIGARYASKFPYASYGTQRFAKGSMLAQAGASYREANAEQRAWRRANNYYGVGGFFGDLWSGAKKVGGRLIKAHGAKALGALGGAFGGPGGAAAGMAAGKALGLGRYNMGGVGAYGDIGQNALVHGGSGDSMSVANVNPTMDDDSGDVIMSHSEFIGNVVATAVMPAGTGTMTAQSQFQNSVYPINPGLQQSFPFLCQLAQNYTMYKLEGIIYQYKPTSGEGGGSTNQLGKVIMATDYDPMALPFINSVQMENYQYSQSTKPSLANRHGVECAPAQGITSMKYVRTGLSNRDKSFTDYGLFQIATEGIPVTGAAGTTVQSNIGELWVSYRVRLSRANLYSSLLGYNIRTDIFDMTFPATAAAGYVTPIVFKNSPVSNNIGCTITAINGSGILYPSQITIAWPVSQILGVYKVTILATGSTTEVGGITQFVPQIEGIVPVTDTNFRTEWGCPFTIIPNSFEDPVVKPKVNLTSGLPTPVGISNVADLRKLCYYSVENPDIVQPTQTSTCVYFAINSPTTTVAKLTLVSYNCNNTTAGGPNAVVSSYFDAQQSVKIFIEQVNAEVSN